MRVLVSRSIFITALLFCLSTSLYAQQDARVTNPVSPPLSSVDEAALRQLTSEFYAAYSRRDLNAAFQLWSAQSPDLAQRRKEMEELFAKASAVEMSSFAVRAVTADGGEQRARVRAVIEMSAVDSKTGKAIAGFGKMNRTLSAVKEGGTWKLWREEGAEDEFARTLAEPRSKAELDDLLAAEKELVTPELHRALIAKGEQQLVQGDYPRALALYHLARRVAAQIENGGGEAQALNKIGYVYLRQGDHVPAAQYMREGLTLYEKVGDKAGIARSWLDLGTIEYVQGNYEQAAKFYQRSLALSEVLNDKAGIARVLLGLGNVHYFQGDYFPALKSYERSLALSEELGSTQRAVQALLAIGNANFSLGNYGAALGHYQKSLALNETLGDKAGVGLSLNNLGIIYRVQGDYAQALDIYQRSLKISESLGDKRILAATLENIGDLYNLQGDYRQAMEFHRKSLAMREALEDKFNIAHTLQSIGMLQVASGEHLEALETLRKSLALFEKIGSKATVSEVLLYIGLVHHLKGDYERAMDFAERSVASAKESGNLGFLWQAQTLSGRIYRALGKPAQARHAFTEAVAIIETLRAQSAGGEQERQRFFESKVPPYHGLVELLVSQHNESEALTYAERAKARVLLDVLRSGRVNVTKAMSQQEREQETKMGRELVSLNAQLSQESLGAKPDEARLADLRARLQTTRLNYEAFRTALYAAHPELKAQRGESQPLTLREAQDLLPDSRTALLEFVVAEDKSYLFVLAREGKGATAAVSVKVYPIEIKQKSLTEQVERLRELLARRDLRFRAEARSLYLTLLEPARTQLAGKETLVIVPDGVLWELPFQALQSKENRYLIEDHAVSYAPSLTVLREMRKRRQGLMASPASSSLLAFGNPALRQETIKRTQAVYRDERLEPLPEAEREVKALAQLYGAQRSKIYTGSGAREKEMKANAGNYRVLHLATHGILDDASPMYSHLLLSQLEGDADEDGLLEAWELMQLDLRAEMVVLSACETARGRIGAGEGMIGLSWALFVAGSPTIVVSQWKVESASTTELMLEFHRNLEAGGPESKLRASKAGALRQAALKLMATAQSRHPFYWAGFVVIGDGG